MSINRTKSQGHSASRFLLPVAGLALILIGFLVAGGGGGDTRTVSEVTRQIRDIALAGADPDAEPRTNVLGPWRLATSGIDPLTGVFHNLRIESGQMLISARTASLIIDPVTDTFTFELQNVTYTRVPDEKEGGDAGFVHTVSYHTLGPNPLRFDVVADGGGGGGTGGAALPRPGLPSSAENDLVAVDDWAVRPE